MHMRSLASLVLLLAAMAPLKSTAQPWGYHELFVVDGQTLYYVGGCQDLGLHMVWGTGSVRLNCPYLPAGTPISGGALIRPSAARGAVWDFIVTVGTEVWSGSGCSLGLHEPGPNGGTSTVLHCPPPNTTPRR